MNTILMVLANNRCKEIILPKMNNADYVLHLNKTIFGWKKHVDLKMENMDDKWSFVLGKEYAVYKEGIEYFGISLKNGDVLEIKKNKEFLASIVVVETKSVFQVYRKYSIENITEITIGKDEKNTIQYDFYGLFSRQHARIIRNGEKYEFYDESTNGVYINGISVRGKQVLHFGDHISSVGLHMVFLDTVLAITCIGNTMQVDEEKLKPYVTAQIEGREKKKELDEKRQKIYFHRSPRNIPQLYQSDIVIEQAPDKGIQKKRSLFTVIGPSITMVIPMMTSCGLYFAVSGSENAAFRLIALASTVVSGIIGAVWGMVNYRESIVESREFERKRVTAYTEYVKRKEAFILEKYQETKRQRTAMYPSAQECCSYGRKNARLWNRNETHEDFLFVRLGMGNMSFQAKIKIPLERFSINEDELNKKTDEIYEKYSVLRDVPVGIDLKKERLWGVVGGNGKTGAYQIVNNIIAQVAANMCYTDVKIVVAYEEKDEMDKEKWEAIKWLPHCWSEDKKIRYFATNAEEIGDVFYELTNVLRMREEEEGTNQPHFILVLEDINLILGKNIAKYVFEEEKDLGLTTLVMVEQYHELPNVCENVIQNDENYTGFYHVKSSAEEKKNVVFDTVDKNTLEEFFRGLSDIEVNEAEAAGEIPNVLDFFKMYGVTNLEEFQVIDNWKKNRTYESLAALIGKKAGGADCFLDVHEKYHGPHGLVAGTTGSGKSETLQTYILSLALNYSPDDIGFFIIDFKGGGMANLFHGLPHLIGEISNLSGNQVKRAMVSIKSENKRRQRIFNEHGVNNINLYTKLLKNKEATIPVPHLFIVIDEFAELKKEHPEFMKELISVAQVGRSLGVHLILATQKPSGTVDNNIWSNTKFRLCLRVQDKMDSNDMLHKPDAAYITQAGRCYLQVGNDEIYELFQSGWSGATYDENMLQQTEIASMLSPVGKTAIVGSKNKRKQKEETKRKWFFNLMECAQKVLQQYGISLGEIKENAAMMDKVIQGIFSELQQTAYDYQNTKNNYARLEDFLQAWQDENDNSDYAMICINNYFEKHGKKMPMPKDKTQLEAVIEYLNKVAKMNSYHYVHQLWLPVLKKQIFLEQLDGFGKQSFDGHSWNSDNGKWTLESLVGMYDDPENQEQMPVTIDFANDGNLAVYGSVVSGKSTFLQTLIYSFLSKYSPAQLNVYCLDFSSRLLGVFEQAPHVGGIMYDNELDKVEKFFHMMNSILAERKELFKGGNYQQFVRANGITVPAIFIVIDNISAFWEKTGDCYYNSLLKYSRDGAGYGIYLIISAAAIRNNEIPARIAENMKSCVCLQMGDKFKYGDLLHTMNFNVMPEQDVCGRGLINYNGAILEFQTALAVAAADDYARGEKIVAQCKEYAACWIGEKAQRVPEIPDKPVFEQFAKLEGYQSSINGKRTIPIGYNRKDASVYNVHLNNVYCYAITGRKRTGKMNLLRILLHGTQQLDGDICIMDTKAGRLKKISMQLDCNYINTEEEMFEYWKNLTPTFRERNLAKHEWVMQGAEETEIFEKMQKFKPIFIFIADMIPFMESIYHPKEGIGAMHGFFENIIEGGAMHNIYFIGAVNVEEADPIMNYKAFRIFMEYKKGMHFGGNIGNNKYLRFDNVSFAEQNKTQKVGIGMTPSAEDENIAEYVVVPQFK